MSSVLGPSIDNGTYCVGGRDKICVSRDIDMH